MTSPWSAPDRRTAEPVPEDLPVASDHDVFLPEPAPHAVTPGRLLVVCTGNVCRSPYIERRLAQLLAGTGIEISSAGTDALEGNPIEPGSVTRLQQVGARHDRFAARRITRDLVDDADLVLTATRDHRAAVVRLQPKALRFCFSLGDFSHLAGHIQPGPVAPGESWVAHVTRLVATVRGSVPARSAEESDIIDPYRRPDHYYDQMVSQIEREIGPLIDVLVPPSRLLT